MWILAELMQGPAPRNRLPDPLAGWALLAGSAITEQFLSSQCNTAVDKATELAEQQNIRSDGADDITSSCGIVIVKQS